MVHVGNGKRGGIYGGRIYIFGTGFRRRLDERQI
jgi:hypothetical protein